MYCTLVYTPFKKLLPFLFSAFLAACFLQPSIPSRAESLYRDVREKEVTESRLVLPYAFWTENNGWFLGLVGGIGNLNNTTTSIGGTAAYSTNDAKYFFLMAQKVRVPPVKRLFFDVIVYDGLYNDLRAYINGNPDFSGQESGSNRSNENNFIEGSGWDSLAEITFKYVLPIGNGRSGPIHTYILDRGLLSSNPSGGESWNPLESGRTFLELKPFYRVQEFDEDSGEFIYKTNGLKLAAIYDNRDFPTNPEKGSLLKLRLWSDFGWFDSDDSWTVVGADFSKYISLGDSPWFRQRVLAFHAWTADTPSWEKAYTPQGLEVKHRPPYFEGATLGGFERLKAYPFYRYNERAAVHYSAEYRVIPTGEPFGANTWLLKRYKLDWWQFVAFIEAGRVADVWSLEELHKDMKWDAGLGLRAMLSKTVFRLDMAYNPDAFSTWVMVGQNF